VNERPRPIIKMGYIDVVKTLAELIGKLFKEVLLQ